MVAPRYVLITLRQYRNCRARPAPWPGATTCAIRWIWRSIAAATAGACIGFLWWNAAPGQDLHGDTGSLALGGVIAGLSVTSCTEILAVVLGALFVAEVTSVVVQDSGLPHHRARGCSGWRRSTYHFELVGVETDGHHPVLVGA